MSIKLSPQIQAVFISIILIFSTIGYADQPVEFADENLKKAVEDRLDKKDPTPSEMLELRWFNYSLDGLTNIKSLKGLEYAKNLTGLHLKDSPIKDFTPLSKLDNLSSLDLDSCGISDLSPLIAAIERLDNLKHLSLMNNEIHNIEPLLKLPHLNQLYLSGNDITDISPLTQFFNLDHLGMDIKPLDKKNASIYKKIRRNNPGIYLHMPYNPKQLILPGILSLIPAILLINGIYRKWNEKGWIFEIIAGLAAAGVGCYFGIGAQILYKGEIEIPLFENGYENPVWLGGVLGAIFGLLTGIWFTQFLREYLAAGYTRTEILKRGTLAGVLMGLICSCTVHALLMIAYRNGHFGPMVIGMGFAVATGTITGCLLSLMFTISNKMRLIQVKE